MNQNEIEEMLKDHERRIHFLEGRKDIKVVKSKVWYKSGSTIEKIVSLIEEGFFSTPHTIGEIVSELKTRDYHLKAPDLTLPLRKIVRKGILRKTKKKSDASISKKWLYTTV